jgi:hypothetical protein
MFVNVTTHTGGNLVISGSNSFIGNAAFVNPADDDYHLTADSLAINAGVDAGVTVDFDGDIRPIEAAFDIGYDEVNTNRLYYFPLIFKNGTP